MLGLSLLNTSDDVEFVHWSFFFFFFWHKYQGVVLMTKYMKTKLKNGSITHTSDSLKPRVTDQSEWAGKTLWGCAFSCHSFSSLFLQLGFKFPDSFTLQLVLVLVELLLGYHLARKPMKHVAQLLFLLSG